MTKHKQITGYLRIDWKNGKLSARKTEPSASELGANELLAPVEINVEVPEIEQTPLSLDLTVPEPRVTASELSQIPDDEMPDWTAVAEENIAASEQEIHATETPEQIRSVVEQIAARVMLDAPGMPKPEHVEEYVNERVVGMLEDDE